MRDPATAKVASAIEHLPTLKQEISLRQLFALGFGSIIGVGWITVLGAWLAGAGAFGAAAAFLVGAVVVLLISFSYAELATRFPSTGGEIVYLHEIFGVTPAFAVGWLLVMGYSSIVVFEAISVGWIVSAIFPQLEGPVLYSIGGGDVTLGSLTAGIVGMIAIAWFNIRGAKTAARLQEIITLLLILLTIVFCTLSLLRGAPDNLSPHFVADGDGLIWTGMAALLVTVPFWFGGFDVIPQAMGEKSQSASLKGVPLALGASIVAAALFYVAIILAASYALPREELLNSDLPVAEAMAAALGSTTGGKIVLFAGLLGLISTWNSLTYGATRVLFALGRARIIAPYFGELDARRRTPVRAILFVSAIGIAGSFFGRSAILPIVDAGAFAYVTTYAAVSLAALVCLGGEQKRTTDAFTMPGGTATRALTAILASALAIFAFYQPYAASENSIPVEWMIFLVWIAAGLAFFLLSKRVRDETDQNTRSALLAREGG